uniref:Uncharacterized protein n=1 Tax=Arundo donax TaxID=35708 RepID=A0A0A9C9J0_ARUDO
MPTPICCYILVHSLSKHHEHRQDLEVIKHGLSNGRCVMCRSCNLKSPPR